MAENMVKLSSQLMEAQEQKRKKLKVKATSG